MIEDWDSELDHDRYVNVEEQTIAPQRRRDTMEFNLFRKLINGGIEQIEG
jgi:hypothetical protein